MKSCKFLDLKDDDFDDYLVVTHNNCLIDQDFMDKYTNEELIKQPESKMDDRFENNQLRESYNVDAENYNNMRSGNSRSEILDQNQAFIKSENSREPLKSQSRYADSDEEVASPPYGESTISPDGIKLENIKNRDKFDHDEEDEKEGGESAESPDVKIQKKPSYKPEYGVFNTEPNVIEESEGNNYRETMFDDPFKIDNYYIENIRNDNDEIKRQRINRLVPPKTINLTEQDEKRMEDFEKQLLNEKNHFAKDAENNLIALNSEIEMMNTNRLTKKEIQKIKERETRIYYMQNLLKRREILNVYAIEFDWLFDKQGAKFIHKISKSDTIELFSLEIIKIMILFFWKHYKSKIIVVSLIPFLIWFVAFIAYATFIHEEEVEEDETWGVWYIVSFVLQIIILVLSAYHIFLEILYLKKNKLTYFTSFWNFVNLATIALVISTVVIDILEIRERVWVPVAAMGVLTMYLKLFYFGRIMNSTSTIVRMIIEISKDIVPFLFLVIVVILGFTNAFYIIALNTDLEEGETRVQRFTNNNVFLAITYTWKNGLGDFITDEFDANNFSVMVYIIWIACTFMVLIVFLNVLIAVLSDSFDKIQETLENNLLKEMATMMSENEVFVNRKKLFKDVKYLIIIKKNFSQSRDRWGGRLDYVNKIVKKTQKLHFNVMDNVVESTKDAYQHKLKKRLMVFQQKTDKSFNHLDDRIDRLDSNINDYKTLFEGLKKKY